MKNKIIGSLAALAAIAALAVGASGTPTTVPTPNPTLSRPEAVLIEGVNTPDVGGTIRWVNATTWTVLDDAGHTPVGLDHVEVLPTALRVWYDTPYTEVVSFQATPDEAFSSANVRVGASVGLNYVTLYFYMPASGATPVNPALLSKAGANVWLTGWFN